MTVEDDALTPAAAAKCKRPASFHGLPDTDAWRWWREVVGGRRCQRRPFDGRGDVGGLPVLTYLTHPRTVAKPPTAPASATQVSYKSLERRACDSQRYPARL